MVIYVHSNANTEFLDIVVASWRVFNPAQNFVKKSKLDRRVQQHPSDRSQKPACCGAYVEGGDDYRQNEPPSRFYCGGISESFCSDRHLPIFRDMFVACFSINIIPVLGVK